MTDNIDVLNGHLDLANKLVEELASTQLSGYESRIIWAVWRKTYCWHKKEDWISYSQFKELTQIGNYSHISRTLKALIDRKILTKNGKSYGFNKYHDQWNKISSRSIKKLPKLVSQVTQIGNKKLPKLAYTKETTKETITKEIIPTVLEASPPDKRNLELQELLDFSDSLNFVLQGTKQMNRFNAYNLWKKFGLEKSKIIVRAAVECRGALYAPRISDFVQLYRKIGDLKVYYQTQKGQQNEFRNFDN